MRNNYFIGYLYGILNFSGSSRFGSEFTRGWFDGSGITRRRPFENILNWTWYFCIFNRTITTSKRLKELLKKIKNGAKPRHEAILGFVVGCYQSRFLGICIYRNNDEFSYFID